MLIFIFIYSNLQILSNKRQYFIYLSIILFKFVVLIYNARFKNLPMANVDWFNYHKFALQILNQGNGIIDIFHNNFDLYSQLVALIYYIFGANVAQIYFYMFLCSLIIFRFLYLTAFELTGDRKKSQITAFLFLVWPMEFLMSIAYLREMPIQCLLIISFYCFVKFIKYGNPLHFLAAVLSITLASMMHPGMIGIVLVYVLVALVYLVWQNRGKLKPLHICLLVIFMLLIIAAPIAYLFESSRMVGIHNINEFIADTHRIRGNTNYVYNPPQNLAGLLIQMPYRVLMFVLAPLPWQVYDLPTLMAWVMDGFLRLFIMYRLILFFIKFRARSSAEKAIEITVILSLLVSYLLLAFGTFTYGTAMRHRTKLFPLEILIAYPCYEMLKSIKRKPNRGNPTQVSRGRFS